MQELEIKARFPGAPGNQTEVARVLYNRLNTGAAKGLKDVCFVQTSTQKNHYFVPVADIASLKVAVAKMIPDADLSAIDVNGSKVSVRTREVINGFDQSVETFLVLKQGKDSENGSDRVEVELPYARAISLLDQMLLAHNVKEQAKWSRTRHLWQATAGKVPVLISLDFNAGYGWIVEIEAVAIPDKMTAEDALKALQKAATDMGLELLDPQLLKGMYELYNSNWPTFYGTRDTFSDAAWEGLTLYSADDATFKERALKVLNKLSEGLREDLHVDAEECMGDFVEAAQAYDEVDGGLSLADEVAYLDDVEE